MPKPDGRSQVCSDLYIKAYVDELFAVLIDENKGDLNTVDEWFLSLPAFCGLNLATLV